MKKSVSLISNLLSIFFVAAVFAQGDFPLKFVNKTNNPAIKNIYIVVKGLNPTTKKQSFIKFTAPDKVGEYVEMQKETDSKEYAYDYRFFKNQTLHLPNVESGRAYISLNEKLTMPIVQDPQGNWGTADPSPYNKTDPSYNLFFDKIEFTYMGNNTWTNPTAVDFFALPLSIEQEGKTYGLTVPRKKIVDTVTKAFNEVPNKAWLSLIVKNDQGTVLRLLAPGRDDQFFDPNYLTGTPYNWVDDVWNYYKKNSLIIDCSELRGNPQAPKLGDYQFEGRVVNGKFVFTNKTKDHTVAIDKPSSNSFFRGAQGAFEATNNTPKAIIVRNLSAAWCVGLLPTEPGATLNRDYYKKNEAKFYTHNPRLDPASKNTGPYYNLYGKAIHTLSKTIYTWSYDDAFGYDGTNGSSDKYPATLTIWDMSQIKF